MRSVSKTQREDLIGGPVDILEANFSCLSLSPPLRQIECMVATEMMQRYRKLQFERGESLPLCTPLQQNRHWRLKSAGEIDLQCGVSGGTNKPEAGGVVTEQHPADSKGRV